MEELAAVQAASKSRLRISAGRALNCTNAKALVGRSETEESSIGHRTVARAVLVGDGTGGERDAVADSSRPQAMK